MMRKRLISFALVLTFVLTCLPLSGGIALAGVADLEAPLAFMTDEDIGAEIVSGDVEAGVEEIELDLGADLAEAPVEFDVSPAAPEWEPDGLDLDLNEVYQEVLAAANDAGQDVPKGISHSVQITQSGNTVTINGSVPSPYFLGGVIVDETFVSKDFFGSTVNYSFNLDNFATGYHTVVVGIYQTNADGTVECIDIVMQTYIEANHITDQPTYNGVFEVYHNYINYYPYSMAVEFYNGMLVNENMKGKLYMEYSSDKGKTWQRSGYMQGNLIKLATQQCFKIDGLKPNTSYKTRIRYGEEATYSSAYGGDDQSHVFLGPALNTTTIKTGKSKAPTIASITAQATNVKYHKNRIAAHYEWVGNVLLWKEAWTERYYTCKVKVTVKLKKKPGTKGLWIGFVDTSGTHEKWVNGNKLTYTATFTPYPNYFSKKPKGNYSYKITVRSGQSKTLGGYSPKTSKKKKLS